MEKTQVLITSLPVQWYLKALAETLDLALVGVFLNVHTVRSLP